jgi:hypothetical protein
MKLSAEQQGEVRERYGIQRLAASVLKDVQNDSTKSAKK